MLLLFGQAAPTSATPQSVTIQLLSDGTVIYSVVVSGQNLTYKVVQS
jgi:hypothetical protein